MVLVAIYLTIKKHSSFNHSNTLLNRYVIDVALFELVCLNSEKYTKIKRINMIESNVGNRHDIFDLSMQTFIRVKNGGELFALILFILLCDINCYIELFVSKIQFFQWILFYFLYTYSNIWR